MASKKELIEMTGLFVLVISAIPNFWSGFLPSLFTIATFSGGDAEKVAHTKRWIRRGELQAIALSMGLGAGASAMSRKPWPILGAAAMCVYLAWQYERALRLGTSADGGLNLDMKAGA